MIALTWQRSRNRRTAHLACPVEGLAAIVATVLATFFLAVPPVEAAFRGDKGRVAFSRDGDLFSVLPDGSDLRVITSTPHDDHWPRWSPDGADLVFVRDGDLFILRQVDTAPDLQQLTGHGGVVGAPSWHPDATSIAYARQNLGIWSLALDTLDTTELIAGPHTTPAWSPRGDWIAFSDGASLFRSNLAGAPVRLTIDPSHRDDQPAWCPDGNRILYRATDAVTSEPFIAFVYPFSPVAGGGFTGGGVATGSEPACRPDSVPAALVNSQTDMVIMRPNGQGGSDILVGPLPNGGASGSDSWFRILAGGTANLNGEADWQPKLARDLRVLESADQTTAVVRVTIPASLPRPLVLNWSLRTLTATAPDDVVDGTGSVSVGTGETEAVIPVTIVGDANPEPDEAFEVVVEFPGFASVARVTIIDDDPLSQGPIAADVASDSSGTDQAAFYSHPDSLAPSAPVQLPSEHIAFSPDGSRIAFRSREAGPYDIWVADTLRPFGSATRITAVAPGSAAGKPAWSPDGESIAFVVDGTIWLMNADGANQRSLVEGDNPTWSPDGLRLAFSRGVGSLDCPACTSSLHVIGVDGTNEQKLLGFPATPSDPWAHQAFPSWDPDWSPDGRYLIYTGQFFVSPDAGFSPPRIMLLDLDSEILVSGNPRPLVDPAGPGSDSCQAPAWSPDGEQVVYSCRNTNPPDAQTPIDTLWVVDRDGLSPRASHLGGVSSDWGSWPSNLQPAVTLDRPFATAITESDADITLTVPVTLSFFNGGAAPGPIAVTWQILPGTATEDVDYSPSSGTFTFRPGETSLPLSLTIRGDDQSEPNESFLLCFVADPNASSCQWSTQVTIRDDDSGNRPPVTVNDIAATAINMPVTIDVVANDSDPDGTPLMLVSAGTPAHGAATLAGGLLTYTPAAGFDGVEHFLYTVSDGVNTAQGAVSVFVGEDQPAPPPNTLTVTPPFLDFGVVPLNKTRDLIVTVTNNTGAPIGMFERWQLTQAPPFPFDVELDGCARVPILNPGDSCTRRIRFWGGPEADAASPASVAIIDSGTSQPAATIPLFASLGQADNGPNTAPILADDFAFLAPGFDHNLDPLRNDTDPEHDLLQLTAVSDPLHGSASILPCAPLHRDTLISDCLGYTPEPGFVGLDSVVYTVTDGRGGEASATFYLSVGNPVPIVSSITPSQGPAAGGQVVRITGANFFRLGTSAEFVCPSVIRRLIINSLSDNEIVATTPPAVGPGVCDLRVRVLAGQPGVLANAYQYQDPVNEADLSIMAGAWPWTVDAGETLRYTVWVTNNGPSPASDVSINVTGPSSLIFGATNSPGGPCVRTPFSNSLDCVVIAPIAPGGQYVLTIDARPTAGGTVSASFNVTGSPGDPAPGNNQVTVDVDVTAVATFTVINTNDAGPGSLRQALINANNKLGRDVIDFDLTGAQTITLLAALPPIVSPVTIDGPGASLLTVRRDGFAADTFRIFDIEASAAPEVAIRGLTLTDGHAAGDGGAVRVAGDGVVSLTLMDSVLTGNAATGAGGAVAVNALTPLTIHGSVISGNVAFGGSGGGISYLGVANLVVRQTTISGNVSMASGGGLFIDEPASVVIEQSTISGNTAATNGGGIHVGDASSDLIVRNSTIVSNTAHSSASGEGGGGIFAPATILPTVVNTILSGNSALNGADLLAGLVRIDFSAIGNTAGFILGGANNLVGANLMLQSLADNGGQTPTHHPSPGSPLINAGSNAAVPTSLLFDQRGTTFVRVFGEIVDIGAVEASPAQVTINQAAGQPDPTNAIPIQFDVVFNQPVTGFGPEDVSFAGSTAGGGLVANVSGSGRTYTVAVSGVAGSGQVVASIVAGAVASVGGLGNFASTSIDNFVTVNLDLPADTTPPVAVLDVPPLMLAGESLTLSGARSTDVGGTVARYRWQIPDAGVDVETTDSSYEVEWALLSALSPDQHTARLIVTDSSGNPSAPASASFSILVSQSITPANGAPPTAPRVPINTGAGDQLDPHVSKDLMAYTDNATAGPSIRFFDFSTGVDAIVPTEFGNHDVLSDANEGRIAFSRSSSTGQFSVLMFVPATGTTHVVAAPGTGFYFDTAIGNNTVAVTEETTSGETQIVTVSLATGLRESLGSAQFNTAPNVSPDGNTLVWQGCNQSFIDCDVFKAIGGPGAWVVSPVTATTSSDMFPDTDGAHIVYSSDRAGSTGATDVYFQPTDGGIETRLNLAGAQRLPSISRGVIAFESTNPGEFAADLYVYDIATNLLYRVTSTANVNEQLNDISVLDNGDVRVVWAANDGPFLDFNVYAKTFSLLPRPMLTVAPAAGVAGESLTLMATLTLNNNPVGDALLEFHLTGDPAVAFDRTDANGVASISGVFNVNPGTYPNGIVVNFPGDLGRRLGPATGTAALTIGRASTALALTTTPNPVVVAGALTATAVVSSAFGIAAGDVLFTLRDSATVTPLGTVPLVNGTATFVHSGLSVGDHAICGEYAGSAVHEGSLNCERVTVVRASSQVNLSSSRNPSITTGPPVFIATIQTMAATQPTGRVEFFANGTLLCRSTVHSLGGVRTQASCGAAPLTLGTHTVTANYTGDSNFDAGSSATLTQTVQPGGYLALDLGFVGEAVALSPNGWVTGNSEVKSALSTSTAVTAYVHNGTTLGTPQPIPSLGGAKTTAVGVDDAGRVGGSSTTATGDTHVFLFDGTTTHDHHNPMFGGPNSRAMAMNSSGVIVGLADTAVGFRAFVHLRAGAFDLGTIAGGTNSAAFAISEPVFGTIGLGHIAGVSTVPGGAGHAALFGGATATDLGTLGGLASSASAVNRAGESAGFSDIAAGSRQAFIHRDGAMFDIGSSLGSSLSLATAMNDAGQVVGTYTDTFSSIPITRTFLHSLDATTDLGPGTFITLNNAGVVVSNVSNRIAVRTGGSVLFLGLGSGSTLPNQGAIFSAAAVNDDGRIAGLVMGANGQPRATVWIPVPLSSLVADAAAAPAGATVTLAATLTSQGAPVANKTIRFSIDDVDAGTALTDASGRATLTTTLPGLAPGVYPEGIRALFIGDETLGAAIATAALTVEAPSADLSIAATVSPATVDAGGTVRYTVTVTNNGPSPASDVSINVTGPASLIFGAANSLCLRTPLVNSLDCIVLAPIPAGGQYELTIDARPTTAGTVSATFTVAANSSDPVSGDNQAVVAVTVNPATDLSIAVLPSRTLLAAGESLTYTVSVTNNGQIAAPAARVSITADIGFTIDQTTLPGLSCIIVSRTWTCVVGIIGPVAAAQFSVIGRVTGSGPGTNTFSVASGLPDPSLANNTVALAFDARPTVTINQAAGQSDPAASAPVNFTVVFSEPVTGFGASDISFAGSSVGGTLAATVSGSGANYNVAVTGMSGVGQVAVSIPAGAAVDSGGNPSAASTSDDSTVLFGVATVVAFVSPSNGGNAAVTALKFGNSLTGILFYSRPGVPPLTATRFTSLVIDGQTAALEGFSTNNRFFVVRARDGGPGGTDTFRLWIEGAEQTAATGAISTGTVVVSPWAPDTRLRGWVDLHTHPMSNLAFGGKLFHGAPSVGSLMPAVQMPNDPECRFDQRATSIAEALSQDGPTRGNPLQSRCGDFARQAVIGAIELFNGASIASIGSGGFPAFTSWPRWSDITHQKMWIDWIRRAWEGGQRVMVALSHNNRALAGMLGAGGPISGVRNDSASSDLQIEEIKQLVGDHSDFMAIARTPEELRTIVEDGKLAVVLGVELDKIGDFSTSSAPTEQTIDAEIARLHAQGVRYILPLHFVDNAFGDTAIHQSLYNVLNFRENGTFFTVGCANTADEIGFQLAALPVILNPLLLPGMPMPPVAPLCVAGGRFFGHVNTRRPNGLTARGEFAIRAMMRRGMIVDIDHMSDRAANRTLAIANAVSGGGYPVTSGHTAVRDRASSQFNAETSRTTTQLARIACLGGMFGLGTDAAGAHRWAQHYERGYNVMRRAFAPNGLCPSTLPLGAGFVALGTDANSLVKTPVPPMLDPGGPIRFADIYNASNPLNAGVPPLARSSTGTRTWDYNTDGVAHYGMFVDFLRDVRHFSLPGLMPGREMVDDQMMYGADYFYRMWLKADTQKTRVP